MSWRVVRFLVPEAVRLIAALLAAWSAVQVCEGPSQGSVQAGRTPFGLSLSQPRHPSVGTCLSI